MHNTFPVKVILFFSYLILSLTPSSLLRLDDSTEHFVIIQQESDFSETSCNFSVLSAWKQDC